MEEPFRHSEAAGDSAEVAAGDASVGPQPSQTENTGGATSADVDVTVVMPCYNAGRFLDQALRSAEQNDRCRLEILVMDDGSTDGSESIMEEHAHRDPRVHVVYKGNEGYGATMNRGFAMAQGTYLAILEPDDWVEPHMYDDLWDYARTFSPLPDIMKGPYWRIWMPETEHQRRLNCAYFGCVHPAHQPFTITECPRLVQHHPSIWSAIYRREFIQEHGIRFKEVLGAGWVDNPFWYETMLQADSIVYLDQPYYCYREDLPGSSSANRVLELSFERWQDMADICDRLNMQDEGVRRALATIAFRYAGEAVAREGLSDEHLRDLMRKMFSRIDSKIILSLDTVSPQMRSLALSLTDREVPHISGAGYARALVREFDHSVHINGVGFTAAQINLYLERRRSQDKRVEGALAHGGKA